MIDIKLYETTGEYVDKKRTSETTVRLLPSDKTARGIEVIAGKVVKYLKTLKGTDAFNPSYGGRALQATQLAESYKSQFVLELTDDVNSCERWIKDADMADGVPGERLSTLYLRDIVFDRLKDYREIDVYIEIVTSLGKRAVVCVTGRTDS